MLTLHFFECNMLFFHACQQENCFENRVRVHGQWTEKSGKQM